LEEGGEFKMKLFIQRVGTDEEIVVDNATLEEKTHYFVVRTPDYLDIRVIHKVAYRLSVEV
jgi:hypothetical protein